MSSNNINNNNNNNIYNFQQSDPTGGLSNFSLLVISLNGLTVVVIVLIIICHRISHDEDDSQNSFLQGGGGQENIPYEQALQDADVSLLNRAQRRARAKLLMKKSRRLVDAPIDTGAVAAAAVDADDHGHDQNDNGDNRIVVPREANNPALQDANTVHRPQGPRLSRKERQKAAKEMERMERIANVQQIQHIQKQREQQEKFKRQQMQMAKLQKLQQDKKEMEEKEYLHRMYMFPDTDLDTRVTVEEFLEELEMNPVISLEETAEEFHVSQEDLVFRLQELERDGRIPHGILNRTRGEYVYIDTNTMNKIAEFILDKGVVSLRDIRGELLSYIHQWNDNGDDDDDGASTNNDDHGIQDIPPVALQQKKNQ